MRKVASLLFYFSLYSFVACAQSTAAAAIHFKRRVITNEFISEGAAVADVNRDGRPDIIAGAYWFEAPEWKKHEITTPKKYDPLTQFSNSFLNYAMDINMDGWVDQLRISLPGEEAVWYENPGKTNQHWRMHPLLDSCGNESPAFVDVDGDGRADLLCNDPTAREMIWMQSPGRAGDTTWTRHVIAAAGAPGTGRYTHGLGFFDMNRDGRKDVVITKGWWEAPPDVLHGNWVFHPADLGEECSQMYSLDADRDGQLDIISASAHDYGIWWHQQIKDSTGTSKWLHHVIYDKFSECHALALHDVNNDGHPDLVTGKRYFAHNGKDRGGMDPAVLYWFEFKPGRQPEWIPHLIDENSGVGLQVLVQDMNKDGRADIIVANKKGVFLFEQSARHN